MTDNTSTKSLVAELLDFFKSSNKRLEYTTAGTIKVDSEKITPQTVIPLLQRYAIEQPRFQPLLLVNTNEVVNAMKVVLAGIARARPTYTEVTVQNYDYSGYIPFQSITDANRYVLFDVTKGVISDLDYDAFRANPETAKIEVVRGRIEFNPYSPTTLEFKKDAYGRSCNFLNTYKRPNWQFNRDIGIDEGRSYKPSSLFIEFMRHLIPQKECREFVYDWLHYALTDRNETYLVLNGAKGIGKNLFSEQLCKPLMGIENHKVAHPSALTSDFNALLAESRMIVFDEFKVDSPEKINKLKRYVNEEQMIERKGVDVANTTKTYNSFIISNNDMTDMKIAWDDRRFSVIDLTKDKLRDVWSDEKIKELLEIFDNEDEMRDIGYWLMYRIPKYSKFDAWKGEHFYALCYSSFAEWQKVIIDIAMTRTVREITASDVKKEYRKRTDASRLPSFVKVRDFIDNYRHNGVDRLGSLIVSSSDNWVLVLDDKFAPEDNPLDDAISGDLLA
jgi:hypothetical protein